nr:unnamed protein product [Haemonchus contortus]
MKYVGTSKLICIAFLFNGGYSKATSDKICKKKNIPESVQSFVLEKLKETRPETSKVKELAYDCGLTKKALRLGWPGVTTYFDARGNFTWTDWEGSLNKALGSEYAKRDIPKMWSSGASKVGCAIRLKTFDNSLHEILLRCVYSK